MGRRVGKGVAGQFAQAFSSVAIVVALSCVALIVSLRFAGASLVSIRQDIASTRDGLGLALAVREQYIHEAHTIIVADGSHVGHHDQWVDRVAQRAEGLAGRIPPSEDWRLRRVSATSRRIDSVFADEIVPAVSDSDEGPRLQEAQARIHSLSELMASDADALVTALEHRMMVSQSSAHRAFQWALVVTVLGLIAALVLAWFQLSRLRRSILVPLRGVAEQAHSSAANPAEWPHAASEISSLSADLGRMRKRLREREDALIRHERAVVIGRLSAGVAEEIDRPLSTIRRRLAVLAGTGVPPTWNEELAILDEEVGCCRRIVEDLIASAGAPRISAAPIRTTELVAEALQRFRRGNADASAPHVRVEEATILADPVWLRQVLTNLMDNAAHAAPSEAIALQGARVGSRYAFRVADRGPGIAPEDRDRLFEPFFSQHPGGTGLGLSVSSAVVKHHGGTLLFEERMGGGAVFRFDVPLAPDA